MSALMISIEVGITKSSEIRSNKDGGQSRHHVAKGKQQETRENKLSRGIHSANDIGGSTIFYLTIDGSNTSYDTTGGSTIFYLTIGVITTYETNSSSTNFYIDFLN